MLPYLTTFASALGVNAVTVNVGCPVLTWSTSQDILLDAIVTASGDVTSTPSGTVQFLENGTPVGSPVPLGPGSAGTAATATTISITTAGNYTITENILVMQPLLRQPREWPVPCRFLRTRRPCS
ncbi:MAG TPA: Ig-like domain-containing protein [Edaphobacter sp.]